MDWTDVLFLLTLLLYAVASVALLAGYIGRSGRAKGLAAGISLAAFGLHTLLLAVTAAAGWNMVVRSLYLLPLSWAFVGIGLVMWLWQKTTVLLLFIPPVAFILLMVAQLLDARGVTVAAAMTGPVFALHLVSIFAGLGLMSVAAGAAVIFLWQQKKLKMKIRLAGLRGDLPSMAALDRINSLATLVGFPFYTLGVICGFAWARLAWGRIFSGDPKELISLIVWALYALLFHQRQALGWQGRKPALMALGIFAASLFSLLVVNFLLPTRHAFQFTF